MQPLTIESLTMPKPCRHCSSEKHSSTFCYQAPRKKIEIRKALKRIGKIGTRWIETRHEWIKANPPKDSYYTCYLKISPICLRKMTTQEMTLDHVMSRTRRPDLRFDFSNLKPCCAPCNVEKGSREVDELRF